MNSNALKGLGEMNHNKRHPLGKGSEAEKATSKRVMAETSGHYQLVSLEKT